MVEIIQTDDTDRIVKAIEANTFSYWTNYGRTPSGEVNDSSDLLCFVSGVDSPLHNGVFRARLQVEEVERAIAKTIKSFAAKGAPFFWWTSPSTQPADLGKYLEAQGLTYLGEFPGMAIDLSNLSSQSSSKDLEIIRVEDKTALKSWLRIAAIGFDIPLELVDEILALEESLGIQSDRRYTRYLALWQQTPVAISELYLDAGVAGIYFVATLPEARGKGIGTEVTLAALEDAQKLGYRVGILQASAMGKNVYRRIGFQECCQLEIYLWQPPEQ
jgi:ribosomal protein S18 acetylase RimI-like enzyme